jgi:hypothetical protein
VEAVDKRKTLCSCRESNPCSSALQPVLILTGTEKSEKVREVSRPKERIKNYEGNLK